MLIDGPHRQVAPVLPHCELSVAGETLIPVAHELCNPSFDAIFHEFDVFIFWGNIIGLLGLLAAMVTEFLDWPMEALVLDPYMRFKILFSAITTQIYIFLVFIRAKLGDKVWDTTSGFLIYGILVVVGGALMIIMGAMGGIAVYNTSILEPLLDWLGLPWP